METGAGTKREISVSGGVDEALGARWMGDDKYVPFEYSRVETMRITQEMHWMIDMLKKIEMWYLCYVLYKHEPKG